MIGFGHPIDRDPYLPESNVCPVRGGVVHDDDTLLLSRGGGAQAARAHEEPSEDLESWIDRDKWMNKSIVSSRSRR